MEHRALERRPSSRWRRVRSHPLTHLVAALVLVALVQSLFVKVYQVPSASMESTVFPGDRLLVNRLEGDPTVGDVVVFHEPQGWSGTPEESATSLRVIAGWFGDVFGFGPSNESALVKRVVGGPGQTVECCDSEGRVTRDGTPVNEPYVSSDYPFQAGFLDCASSPRSLRCFPPVTVGTTEYLMLGDNRAASSDSILPCRGLELRSSDECARPVPRRQVIGKAFFVLLPLTRWGQSLAMDTSQ